MNTNFNALALEARNYIRAVRWNAYRGARDTGSGIEGSKQRAARSAERMATAMCADLAIMGVTVDKDFLLS